VTAFSVQTGSIDAAYRSACGHLRQASFVERLWAKRLDLWSADPAVQQLIGHRLGWLGAVEFAGGHVPRLRAFASSIVDAGLTHVVLLGMGGSSLAPEVLRRVLGVAPGLPQFRTLDSVDPDAVRAALADTSTSLFLFASKSGTTIEPNVMAAEARYRLETGGHGPWGARFVAITDENTHLHRVAVEQQFRDVFLNPADIGGRYSALSFFGMVPAALMGLDLEAILASAAEMEQRCQTADPAENPALALGALMAAGALEGRDKLTLFLPERLRPLGLWIEQLVAESTGKQGRGVVPIAGETAQRPWGADRVAVAISYGDDEPDPVVLDSARHAGLPLIEWHVSDGLALGAEFVRWELATAAAGFLLGINPFDEPNVQQAKDATRVLLDQYRSRRELPFPDPHLRVAGARLALSAAARDRLDGVPETSFLGLLQDGDYFSLLAYLPPDHVAFETALEAFRTTVTKRTGCAGMIGYGPRYLHSTGQLHKGGANSGVFVLVTADPHIDLPIPGEAFSFGVLELAQALGDFQSLDRTSRRALHVHLPRRDVDLLDRVLALLVDALEHKDGNTGQP
jgi:hypothetical protein